MPKGVEHNMHLWAEWQNIYPRNSVMPKGVEHARQIVPAFEGAPRETP